MSPSPGGYSCAAQKAGACRRTPSKLIARRAGEIRGALAGLRAAARSERPASTTSVAATRCIRRSTPSPPCRVMPPLSPRSVSRSAERIWHVGAHSARPVTRTCCYDSQISRPADAALRDDRPISGTFRLAPARSIPRPPSEAYARTADHHLYLPARLMRRLDRQHPVGAQDLLQLVVRKSRDRPVIRACHGARGDQGIYHGFLHALDRCCEQRV